MEERYVKIERFLTVCNELIGGKFILADTKIGELLKIVASSNELTDLFSAVTERFDYVEAKNAYLRFPAYKGSAHGAAYLPAERGDLLAFVFCLLVDFDSGTMRLNDFLLRYFYEDGSYTASYAIFVDRMIRPFRDIVSGCFPQLGSKTRQIQEELQKENTILEALSQRVSVERARISELALSQDDSVAADAMLSAIIVVIGRADLDEIRALLCGYSYFLRAVNADAEDCCEMFALAEQL